MKGGRVGFLVVHIPKDVIFRVIRVKLAFLALVKELEGARVLMVGEG